MTPFEDPSEEGKAGEIIVATFVGVMFLAVGIYVRWAQDLVLGQGGGHGHRWHEVYFAGSPAVVGGMWLIFAGLLCAAFPFRSHHRTIAIVFGIAAVLLVAVSVFMLS